MAIFFNPSHQQTLLFTSVDGLDVSVRWLQFHLKFLYHFCYSILPNK
ncbi:unnamed protein product [Staurois parvus]|uniref:Uncharacterized protein n=1 Tax=Staurois parvus TaxID=386267 RepID=A0ABN9HA45_9NEOB|nr:unnamed protein product [Staurois parvus]